jgi:tetratricopeptide (TPR) repeat protein
MKSVVGAIAVVLLAAFGCLLVCSSGYAHEHADQMPADAKLGTVSFVISCKSELQPDFNRAIVQLHSFLHNEAQQAFEKIAVADPSCAIAYWGEAMSHFHLGLSWPTPADLTTGAEALSKADAATEKTPREAAYIRALHVLYDNFKPEDSWVSFQFYAQAMAQLGAAYPSDLEAKVFYALALGLSQPPDDVELVETKKEVQILAPLLREHPSHPGIAHYLIHACDRPQLAQQGLEAARRYAQIAPASPHAVHMPGHIFARLGLWQEDIRSNLASKAAAEKTDAGAENRLHAMEFLEYAYLQIGHYNEARAIMGEAKTISHSEVDPRYGSYYAIVQARFPAMFAIETHDWQMAAQSEPISGDDGSGQELTLLAHAIAAGHLRDRALASAALKASQALMKERLNGRPIPRSGTAEATFLDEIQAWTDFANRDLHGAVRLLRPIADRQDKVGKGELDLPVREMMAEMFLSDGKTDQSLREYQASLKSDPNRFNGLLGAAKSAEQLGQRDLAVGYYRTLLTNCAGANGEAIAELKHAQAMVSESAVSAVSVEQ